MNDADTLGFLLAQIAELTTKAEAIKNDMKDKATSGGPAMFEGNMFLSRVIESNRKVVDWQQVAAAAQVPPDIIEENTSITAVFSVKTTSRQSATK
jgi:hypothetical protein